MKGASNVTLLARATHSELFQPNRFWVYVDGVQSQFVPDTIHSGDSTIDRYVIADGLTPEVHTILVVKITEPQWNEREV